MAYSWNPCDAIELCGVKVNRSQKEVKIQCPFCGSKNFGFNTIKGMGHCWKCENNADSAKYYAVTFDITPAEARKEIEQKLGIKEFEPGKRPERITNEPKKFEKAEEEIASAEIRNATYNAFLDKMPLTQKTVDNLLSRGFSNNQIEALKYKTFIPMTEAERCKIAKDLLADGYQLENVPGFYVNNANNWSFIQLTQGTIMPCRNHRGLITGLQVRKDDDCRVYNADEGEWEPKCSWFSSNNRYKGTKAHADVHYACEFVPLNDPNKPNVDRPVFGKGFALTEGIMKADLVHFINPNLPLLAVPGVHALKGLELEVKRVKAMGGEQIILAYDMDYKTNESVQNALEKTKQIIKENGLELKVYEWEDTIEVNGETVHLKGIDDMVVYAKLGIVPKSAI